MSRRVVFRVDVIVNASQASMQYRIGFRHRVPIFRIAVFVDVLLNQRSETDSVDDVQFRIFFLSLAKMFALLALIHHSPAQLSEHGFADENASVGNLEETVEDFFHISATQM